MNLDDARELALQLPETHEQPHFDLTSFRVGTKIFATAPVDGDHIRVFVDEDEIRTCAAEAPHIYAELYWGKKLAALKVTLATADGDALAELLEDSWRRKAPKKLIAEFDATREPRLIMTAHSVRPTVSAVCRPRDIECRPGISAVAGRAVVTETR